MIGTPGRVEEIMKKLDNRFNTKELEVLVMDEADRYGLAIMASNQIVFVLFLIWLLLQQKIVGNGFPT